MKQLYNIIIDNTNEDNPNIVITIDDDVVVITLNKYRLFNTMANLETILVGLNEQVKKLIQNHLKSKAFTENKLRCGR